MRDEKNFLLDDLVNQIKQKNGFVVLGYNALNANKMNELRNLIAACGSSLEMVKKRILFKALSELEIDFSGVDLNGHIGIMLLDEDPIDSLKKLFDFSKDNEGLLSIANGYIDGNLLSGSEVDRLSKLPNKDGMRAELLSIFEAPMAQTLSVIDALLTSVIHCMDNKNKKS